MMDPSEVQRAIDRVSRLRLIRLPTPLHECPRLSERLGGPGIFIKRDDLTDLAFGGNKSRYLEFTLAEAVDAGADAVVLTAVVQSNHCRQLAAAAAKVGLKAVLVLREDESPMGRHDRPSANDLLDRLFGAEIRFAEPDRVQSAVAEEMDRLRSGGYRPFTGLTPLRSRVAYIQCALELVGQYDELGVRPGHIYIGSGGNSLAGLVAGFGLLGRKTPFVGFPQSKLDQPSEAPARIAHSAAEAADFIGLSCTPDPAHIHVDDGYVGSGFGLLDPTTRDAIHLLARTEAILVDPTYTGKAFAGLLAHIRQGRIGPDQDVVFVHTGGTPLTFAYGDQLL